MADAEEMPTARRGQESVQGDLRWFAMGDANNIPGIEALCGQGIELTIIDSHNQTVLHFVRNPVVCEYFLNHGVWPLINYPDDDGRTALHAQTVRVIFDIVFTNGRIPNLLDIIHVLLAHGANPFALNNRGLTPRQEAEARFADLMNRRMLSPEAQGELEELIRILREAEEAYLVAYPNARDEAIEVLRRRRVIIQIRLAERRAELEAARVLGWRQHMEEEIRGLEQGLAIIAEAEASVRESEE
jgi:hypothetical protein